MRSLSVLAAVSFLGLCASQRTPTLGLSSGLVSFTTSDFTLTLVNASGTAYSLRPRNVAVAGHPFDFLPYDKMGQRQYDGNYHLGDLTFRVRAVGASSWISADTSSKRATVKTLPSGNGNLAAAFLGPTLPTAATALLNVTRRWTTDTGGVLQLLFDIKNVASKSVEIGSLGIPIEINNIFSDRTADDTNSNCSVADPYIGLGAGYVQATPLLGTLPPLLVLPASNSTPLEGWRFLPESDTADAPYYQSQTFEGVYEWMAHTSAYATNEWKAVKPWNIASSAILQPSETRTYGVQFRLSKSIRGIDDALTSAGHPVARGIPGYIVPSDAVATLYLRHSAKAASFVTEPASALAITPSTSAVPSNGWTAYDVTPSSTSWGRVRLTITYADGLVQTVHYYVTKSGPAALADLGNFLTTNQWFEDASDPFGRSPSVISYDREAGSIVKDDPRAWIPGLSDEAGAGSWLAALVKQAAQPSATELAKLERFVNKTLWGSIQNTDGTVKKSVYYHEPALVKNYNYPSSINWGNWWSWSRAASYATDRAYDYVHVTAGWWSLYRVARNYPTLLKGTWQWYLQRAVGTIQAMMSGNVGYTDVGLMGETVIVRLLEDLKREGLTTQAADVQARMKARESLWKTQRYPFGSEMAWDSTGQEGVYAWASYFNDSTTATNTVNSVLGYQPSIPHWGYNANARRYWDNIYGGKLQRIERQIHHYGSALNALPLLGAATANGVDPYLLRTGFAGISAPLSSIDQGGFASASFHSFADTLKWDGYSGDYGPGFLGHVLGTGAYIYQDTELGWVAFGGVVQSQNATGAEVLVRDSSRRRVFVASVGATFELHSGVFDHVAINDGQVVLQVLSKPVGAGSAADAPAARLVASGQVLRETGGAASDGGALKASFTDGKAKFVFHK